MATRKGRTKRTTSKRPGANAAALTGVAVAGAGVASLAATTTNARRLQQERDAALAELAQLRDANMRLAQESERRRVAEVEALRAREEIDRLRAEVERLAKRASEAAEFRKRMPDISRMVEQYHQLRAEADAITILQDRDLDARLQALIKDSTEKLLIVSPYIKIQEAVRTKLLEARARGVKTHLLLRDNGRVTPRTWSVIREVFDTVREARDLHAKCFVSESRAIIGSQNVYSASSTNLEVGVEVAAPNPGYATILAAVREYREGATAVTVAAIETRMKAAVCCDCGAENPTAHLGQRCPDCFEKTRTWRRKS